MSHNTYFNREFRTLTGSCGACQPGIVLGDLVLSSGSVHEDGASAADGEKREILTALEELCI